MTRATWRRRVTTGMVGVALAGMLIAGCTSDGSDDSAEQEAFPEAVSGLEVAPDDMDPVEDEARALDAEGGTGSLTTVDGELQADRSVIYTVDLTVEVDDIAKAARQAEAVAQRFGGYVQSESTFSDRPSGCYEDEFGTPICPPSGSSAYVVVRVPVDRHLEVITALEDIGETVSRSRSAEDVTEEVIDVESRIETQEASIQRLRALLSEATKISDILAIETEITQRTAELESLKARQKYLTGMSEMATITTTFVLPGTVVEEGTGFLAGLEAGWDAFVRALELGLTALGALVPFLVALAIVLVPLVWWLVARHRRSTRARAEQQAGPAPTAPVRPDETAQVPSVPTTQEPSGSEESGADRDR